MIMHDADDCSIEVEKRLERILVTSDLAKRSRLLCEAVAWHQRAIILARQRHCLPRADAEIIAFRRPAVREIGGSR